MARPTTIKDEDILAAARAVYRSRGVRATTAEIAERAGISESSLFNRFKSKTELLHAALLEANPPYQRALAEPLGERSIEEKVHEVATHLANDLARLLPVALASDDGPAPLLEGIVEELRRSFAAEQKKSRLSGDPTALARMLVGALCMHVILDDGKKRSLGLDRYLEQAVLPAFRQ
jgi:AcrR family transcriptional regulator